MRGKCDGRGREEREGGREREREREGEREGERETEKESNNFVILIATVTTYNSNDCEEHDDSKCEKGNESIGLDMGVAILIHLHQNYTSSDEHERSICIMDKN